MHFGNKVISVNNSRIDVHGKPRTVWTYVKETIKVGATKFTTKAKTDWTTGDYIVVAATGYDMDEAEDFKIKECTHTDTESTCTVDKPFRFEHYSASETYGSK